MLPRAEAAPYARASAQVTPVADEWGAVEDRDLGAIWSVSPSFSSQVRWFVASMVVVFASLCVFFARTVTDAPGPRSEVFLKFSLVTSSAFFTGAALNWVAMWRDWPDGYEFGTVELANKKGCRAMYEMIVAINIIAGVSHGMMALDAMPVHESVFGQRLSSAQIAEWCTCVPMLMVLIHAIEEARCVPSRQLLGHPARFVRWCVVTDSAAMVRSTVLLTLSTVIGAIPTLYDVPLGWAWALLAVSCLMFCQIFAVLARLIRRAKAQQLGGFIIDSELYNNKIINEKKKNTNKNETNDDDPLAESAARKTAGVLEERRYRMMFGDSVPSKRDADRAAKCVRLCVTCVISWTLIVLVYCAGCAGLVSDTMEAVAHATLDIVSKVFYASAVTQSHIRDLSPEAVLEKLLKVERLATDQRRRFLRYVMHEVRVPLNTVHLGVQTVIDHERSLQRGHRGFLSGSPTAPYQRHGPTRRKQQQQPHPEREKAEDDHIPTSTPTDGEEHRPHRDGSSSSLLREAATADGAGEPGGDVEDPRFAAGGTSRSRSSSSTKRGGEGGGEPRPSSREVVLTSRRGGGKARREVFDISKSPPPPSSAERRGTQHGEGSAEKACSDDDDDDEEEEEEEEEEDILDILLLVKRAIDAMTATLDDTLSFAAIEEGRFDLHLSTFDPTSVLTSALELFQAAAADKGLELVVEHPTGPLPHLVRGDSRRLASVVGNFVSNAIKFSPRNAEARVTLRLSTYHVDRCSTPPLADDDNNDDDDAEGNNGPQKRRSSSRGSTAHSMTTRTLASSSATSSPRTTPRKNHLGDLYPALSTRAFTGEKNDDNNNNNNNRRSRPSTRALASARNTMTATKTKKKAESARASTPPPRPPLGGVGGGPAMAASSGARALRPAAVTDETLPAVDASKVWICVEVVDEGVGISDEDQQRLFEAFSQIRPGDLQEGRGSGLGLAISKKIIELHGGRVGVQSEPQVGSTFFFLVPFDRGGKGEPPHEPPSLAVRRRSSSTMLASRGLSVDTAPTSTSELPETCLLQATTPKDALNTREVVARSDIFAPLHHQQQQTRHSDGNNNDNSSNNDDNNKNNNNNNNNNKRKKKKRGSPPNDDSEAHPPGCASSSSSSSPRGTAARKRRALVVDDVFVNRKLLAKCLSKSGFDCALAADGFEAVEKFRANRGGFSLICMDSCMPVMNGLAATRILREEGFDGLILGCTGNALAEDISAFVDAGANSVVTKPISMDKLDFEINRYDC